MKDFLQKLISWFEIKKRIILNQNTPPFTKEGELWWIYIGQNVGTEISGKSQKFSRPAIIFKKLSRFTFLIIPNSTRLKKGTWYIPFSYKNTNMIACLHQIRIIDYRRLDDKIGELEKNDFQKIKTGFQKLYT